MQGSLLATQAWCHLACGCSRFVRHSLAALAARGLVAVLSIVFAAFAALALSACGRNYPPPPNLPDPVVNLQVGPGDVLEVVILGEEKLPKDYEIQPDGSLDFPYIAKSIKVAGLEPRAIATAIHDQLVEAKFLVSPQVQVKVKAFNSKKIQIIGQIAKPGPLPYQDGMTLVQAISAAGWFTPLADTNHVQLIRIVNGSEVRQRDRQRRRHHRQRARRREAPAGRHHQGRPAPLLESARGSPLLMPRLLLLLTGGTMLMTPSTAPAGAGARPLTLDEERTSRDLVAEVPSLARIAELDTRHLFQMDSANMQPGDWVTIARAVHTELPSYDGVVIVHGTDTMAYTASALALMLGPLPKPVVLTGSQKPIGDVRTDARQNLTDAALVATLGVPEVSIVSGSRALRGVRATKRDAWGFSAFDSPNLPSARRARHRDRDRAARRQAGGARRASTTASSRGCSRCVFSPVSIRIWCVERSASACAASCSRPTARGRCRTSWGRSSRRSTRRASAGCPSSSCRSACVGSSTSAATKAAWRRPPRG